MSNISVTGNEAQFNEKVTFLKDVEIKGTLSVPETQELNLKKVITPDIEGSPNLQITGDSITVSGETTFLNQVNFQETLSFPNLEIRDILKVGAGGTVITADSSLNPGKVGIGSTQPTELLDVFGKAKIIDLDLTNLNVTGLSTFVGVSTFNNQIFTNKISNSGIITSNMIHLTGGSFTAPAPGGNTKNDTAIVVNENFGIYSLELQTGEGNNNKFLRSIIQKDSNVISIGEPDTDFIEAIDLQPGLSGSVRIHHGTTSTSNIKIETSGVGATVFGSIHAVDVGVNTSRIGIGTNVIEPVNTNSFDDTTQGTLRLAVKGSISIERNIYDSAGAPGADGFFLKRDGTGIRWTAIAPGEGGGISLQNEGQDVPSSGLAQTFTTINFSQTNSFGIGVDNLVATAADTSTNQGNSISTVFTNDFWGVVEGHTGVDTGIYRMTNVGIGSSVPSVTLDVKGDTKIDGTFTVVGLSTFVGITTNESTLFTNQLSASGISTFVGNIDANADLDVDGHTELDDVNVSGFSTFSELVDINDGGQANTFKVEDLTDNRVVIAGSGGELEDDANLTFDGSTLSVGVNLDVDGHTELDGLQVSGVSTFNNNIDANADLDVDGHTELDDVNVSGVSTFNDISRFKEDVEFHGATGVTSISFDKSDNSLKFVDNAKLKLGNGGDLELYHTGARSEIINNTGDLVIQPGIDSSLLLRSQSGAPHFKGVHDAEVEIYHSGNKKLQTLGFGITVFGITETQLLNVTGVSTFIGLSTFNNGIIVESGISTFSDNVIVGTSATVGFGTTAYFFQTVEFFPPTDKDGLIIDIGDDASTGSHIKLKGVGPQIIDFRGNFDADGIKFSYNTSDNLLKIQKSDDDNYVFLSADRDDGKVEIGHGGTKKLETTASGIDITGTLKVSGISTFGNTIELDGALKDVNDTIADPGAGKTDYRLSSVGTGVSWRPSGVQTKRTIWVSKNGSDSNSGLLEGDAKATVGAAASIAVETDTIKIRPGVYEENNPIGLRTDVSVTGEDIRLVTIQPKNTFKDVFHVRRGCLIENLNFGGSNVGEPHDGAACVAFPPPAGSDSAITGYTEPGPATEGPSGRWRSPYIRNCTNFMTGSIGMKVDGNNATATVPGSGADLKSMVCDSFTQYNEAGIGVSLTNDAYAQLVSIFTINTDIGIFASSGAQCDLTNSNSSFGNFGLVAVGLGSTQFTGIVSNTNPAGDVIASTVADQQDTVVATGVTDSSNSPRRPFDGQALFFRINLDNYPDVVGSGRITSPLQELGSIKLIGTPQELSGFSPLDPPDVLIRDVDGIQEPKGPQAIIAEATATVNAAGVLTEIDVVASGRNYLSTQNIVVDIEGNTGIATAVMSPILFTVESATEPTSTGITTITFNEFIPYELFPDDPFSLQRISRILTSSHSFEYVGTGTAINNSVPLRGAIPIKANEVVATDGAQIPFTSTDQKGNFDIGQGLQINQTTSTISGRDFSRSLQAEVTPLILALR